MKKILSVAITTGDHDGIGLEISAKALAKIKPQKNVQFYLWRPHNTPDSFFRPIDRSFKRTTVYDWKSALEIEPQANKMLIDIASPLPPPRWVEQMAYAGLSKKIDALVTAPLSKTAIHQAGLKDRGHTDILKRICKNKNVYMLFGGQYFNVALCTDHLPLDEAYKKCDEETLFECIRLSHEFKNHLPLKIKNRPLGLVGINPHAGESGLIGFKERDVFIPVITRAEKSKISVTKPLVGDVCFQKKYWNNYSIYIASYHDQGLIPFKMAHGAGSGVHLSLGLPFVRTSVDHGTAKDIFGKNKADARSMLRALTAAVQLLKKQTLTW